MCVSAEQKKKREVRRRRRQERTSKNHAKMKIGFNVNGEIDI